MATVSTASTRTRCGHTYGLAEPPKLARLGLRRLLLLYHLLLLRRLRLHWRAHVRVVRLRRRGLLVLRGRAGLVRRRWGWGLLVARLGVRGAVRGLGRAAGVRGRGERGRGRVGGGVVGELLDVVGGEEALAAVDLAGPPVGVGLGDDFDDVAGAEGEVVLLLMARIGM